MSTIESLTVAAFNAKLAHRKAELELELAQNEQRITSICDDAQTDLQRELRGAGYCGMLSNVVKIAKRAEKQTAKLRRKQVGLYRRLERLQSAYIVKPEQVNGERIPAGWESVGTDHD